MVGTHVYGIAGASGLTTEFGLVTASSPVVPVTGKSAANR